MRLISNKIKQLIKYEVSLLEDIDDCFGLKIARNKGVFVEVVDYGDGKEYFIELNDIDSDGAYIPCSSFNASSAYGDIKNLLLIIEDLVKKEII
jgi:hypothetical protein